MTYSQGLMYFKVLATVTVARRPHTKATSLFINLDGRWVSQKLLKRKTFVVAGARFEPKIHNTKIHNTMSNTL